MASRGNSLGDLVVRLGADIADFKADLGRANRIAQKELGGIERSARGIQNSFRNLGRGLAAGLSVGAFVGFVRSGIDAADAIDELSLKTSLSVEKLSLLDAATARSGTSLAAVGVAVRNLGSLMGQAAAGSDSAARKLAFFGATTEDSLDTALEKVLLRLGQMPAGFQKIEAGKQVFGRSAQALIPLETELAKTGGLVDDVSLKFGKEAAESANKFNDALSDLEKALRAGFLEAAVPGIQAFTNELEGGKTKVHELGAAIGTAASFILNNFQLIVTAVESLLAVLTINLAGRGVAAIVSFGASLRGAMTTAGLLAGGLTALGGPIGAITALLGLGATAWIAWGNRASAAGAQASEAMLEANGLIAEFARNAKLAAAGGSRIGASVNALTSEADGLKAQLGGVQEKIKALQNPGSLGFVIESQRLQEQASIIRGSIDKTIGKIAELRKVEAATPKPAEPPASPSYKEAFGKPPKSVKGGAAKAIKELKDIIDAEIALIKDANDRALSELDGRLKDHQVTLKGYYDERVGLEQSAINAEIAGLERELTEAGRGAGSRAKIESEITILRRKRADVVIQAARDEAEAEQKVTDTVTDLHTRLAELQGRPIEARRLRIDQDIKQILDQFPGQVPADVVALTVELRGAETARAEFEDLQRQLQAIEERRNLKEQSIQAEADTGLFGEFTQRGRLVEVYQETAVALDALLPRLRDLASAHPDLPEIANAVIQAETEFKGLQNTTSQIGLEISRDLESGFSNAFAGFIQGTKTASQSFADFGASVLDSISNLLANQLAKSLFGGFAGGVEGGGIGGILGSILGLFGGAAGGEAGELAALGMDAAGHLAVAKGAAFNRGSVIPFARGGLVRSPTFFPMASGMGLMGEAGPEAVLPLKRLGGGNLGVMAQLSDRTKAGSGDTIVNFHLPGVRDPSEFKQSVGQSARNAAQLLGRASRRNG